MRRQKVQVKNIIQIIVIIFAMVLTSCPDSAAKQTDSSGLSSGTNPGPSGAKPGSLSTLKTLTSFAISVPHQADLSIYLSILSESTKTVTIIPPFGQALTALTPVIAYTGKSISPASGVAQDFLNPVGYTVKAADGSTVVYTVSASYATRGEDVPTLNFNVVHAGADVKWVGPFIDDGIIKIELSQYNYGVDEYGDLSMDVTYGKTSLTCETTKPNFTSPVKYIRTNGGSTEEYTLRVLNKPITRAQLDTLITGNKDLTLLNTFSITNMEELFLNKAAFNQDISGWDVSKVTKYEGHV